MSGRSKSLFQFLKQARKNSKLSQKQVADELGYESAQFISNWERGISSPPIKKLKKLGELYHVSADELYELMVGDILHRIEADLYRQFYGSKLPDKQGSRRIQKK